MRIGLTGGGAAADRIVSQAKRAEADGFTSLWYPGAAGAGDPLPVMALAGRATAAIELATAVLPSHTCHPALQASRANAVVSAIGATDVWAAPFPVGDDAAGSRARTRGLLASLART